MATDTNPNERALTGATPRGSFFQQTIGAVAVDLFEPVELPNDGVAVVAADLSLSRIDGANDKRAVLTFAGLMTMKGGIFAVDGITSSTILGGDAAAFAGAAVACTFGGGKMSCKFTGAAGATINIAGNARTIITP
jgi:hypothetical protein